MGTRGAIAACRRAPNYEGKGKVRVGGMETIARRRGGGAGGGEFAGEEVVGKGSDRAAPGRALFCGSVPAGAWWGPPLVGANERACAPMLTFTWLWNDVFRRNY
jgi:hypothetical protein